MDLVLSNYTYIFYSNKEREKSQASFMLGEEHVSTNRCLYNIKNLIQACTILLQNSSIFDKMEIIIKVVDFWCREELTQVSD